jgi:hypothetical protein
MFNLFLHDAWTVLITSLVLGAGLPVLYTIGVRTLAIGSLTGSPEGLREGDPARKPSALARVVAVICFAVVIVGVLIGLSYIVAAGQGDKLNFDHVFPRFVPK